MSKLNDEVRANLKSKMRELLLLPSRGLQETEFTKSEEKLVATLDKIIIDPNWTDYLFYPSKNGLPDCMFENEKGVFEVDDNSIEVVIEKIENYKPIIL